MKLKEKTQEQLVAEAFAIFNGGEGLDHWSYSSTSSKLSNHELSFNISCQVTLTLLYLNFLIPRTVQILYGYFIVCYF